VHVAIFDQPYWERSPPGRSTHGGCRSSSQPSLAIVKTRVRVVLLLLLLLLLL
jgi:hypothetical protein